MFPESKIGIEFFKKGFTLKVNFINHDVTFYFSLFYLFLDRLGISDGHKCK